MNKSLVAMNKAGLVKATAHTPDQQRIANDYVMHASRFCHLREEATFQACHESYLMGLKGIRIGQEAEYGCQG